MNENMKRYLKVQIRDKELYMDLSNMLLGMVIVVLTMLCLLNSGDTISWYPVIFLLGSVMALINALKFHKKSRVMTGIGIACAIVLILASVACIAFLIQLVGEWG